MANLNILIVEDELMAFLYLKDLLENLGYQTIYHTKNSKETIEFLNTNSIDLIFMDINIDGATDGIQCATEIKPRDIPIIFSTAHCDEYILQEVQKSNIYGYIVKPFHLEQVKATLNVALTLINRAPRTPISHIITLGEYEFNNKTKTLKQNDILIDFPNKELKIVDLFFNYANENVSYSMLKNYVWEGDEIADSTIRDAISKVKKKLPLVTIKNIKNFGYVLKH